MKTLWMFMIPVLFLTQMSSKLDIRNTDGKESLWNDQSMRIINEVDSHPILSASNWVRGGTSPENDGIFYTEVKSGKMGWISSKIRNKRIKTINGNRGGGLKQTIRLSHWNIGNSWWENKKTEIMALIIEEDPDLFFISEANMREDITPEEKYIDGYYHITPNTAVGMGYSRLILLVKEGVKVSIMDECMDVTIPAIWVKIISRGRKPLVVGGLYREHHLLLQPQPNNTDMRHLQNARWKKSLTGWTKAARNTKCVLIGDLNLDYVKWADPDYRNKRMVQDTKDTIEQLGFCQIISEVTRAWPGTPSSLVDHIWTNAPGCIMTTKNSVRSASDHNHISAILRTKDREEMKHETTRRNRKDMDIKEYKRRISILDWSDFLNCQDINLLNSTFVDKVGGILDELAPLRTYQMRRRHINWLSNEMKSEMRMRDLSRETARRTGEARHWSLYRKLRNKCSKNLIKSKNEHFRTMYKKFESENDTKSIFRTTKNLLNWGGGSPQSFLMEGKLFRRPIDLANLQLKIFEDKVDKLTRHLTGLQTNPLRWLKLATSRWESYDTLPNFTFSEVSVSEITNLIAKLGNLSALGLDNIDSQAIKDATPHLTVPIRHIVNISLRSSTYANKWKLSKIVPLLKSKDLNKMSPASFRPIAILPALSKIVEKAVQTQILRFFEEYRLLNDCSHAYRKGYSTTTTLLEITDKLYQAIDEKKLASVMTIDQSAAFDCVSHDNLLEKLRLYELDENSITWMKSYLENRTQFVAIGSAISRMGVVGRGVPQGSILGPLLYSIYTNEMSECIIDTNCSDETHKNTAKLFNSDCTKCGSLTQYADDATFITTDKLRQTNQVRLRENIENLKIFLETNELTVNADKTKIVEIMIQQKRTRTPGEPPSLTVMSNQGNIETIHDSKYCRVLGLNLQNNMTLNSHLETGSKSLLPSLRKNLGALRSLGEKIPQGSRNTMARGLILSRISYLISIWGGSTENLIRKAQIVQNAAARWVLGCGKKTRISTLIDRTGWYTIREMEKISSSTQIWKMLYNMTPRRLTEKISFDIDTKLITITEPRISFTKQNFIHRASQDWNLIPDHMRQIKNLSSFKRQFKNWVKDQREPRAPD